MRRLLITLAAGMLTTGLLIAALFVASRVTRASFAYSSRPDVQLVSPYPVIKIKPATQGDVWLCDIADDEDESFHCVQGPAPDIVEGYVGVKQANGITVFWRRHTSSTR